MFRSRRGAHSERVREEDKASDFSERLVTISEPTGAATEAYRTLRTNLFYAVVDTPPRVIAFTSPGPREGKSTTCTNLGVVLAQADKRVLLVDCDLRKPTVHEVFGARNLWGLSDVMVGRRSLQEAWQEPLPGMKVVTAGPLPPNPAELLGSRRFAEFLREARQEFDYVLLDTPPVNLVSDPIILATQGDGVLLVFDSQSTRKDSLRESVRSLEAVGANILGTVMNNVKASKGSYSYYGYQGYTGK